ncbi:MAG: YfcE family phosphodiesterase [Patescibacteria group bacterium]|nr:YfcE family phosphodiesterase [Patescibacteria group bacterium]MCX7589510.1 YfcE family phosphodiesterase [Patescibacteria group bacterium]MDW8279932.1 YfcE family phosphodiesterase [bacterium]
MQIAIISDTHDNYKNLIKALTLINQNKVSALIHCGDVTSLDTLKIIIENFNNPIYLSLGNGDDQQIFFNFLNKNKNLNLNIFSDFGQFNIENIKIGLTHFPDFIKNHLINNFDFIFYGHTHKPWEEKINNTIVLNPGNIAGILYRPSFAILDIKSLKRKLVIVE